MERSEFLAAIGLNGSAVAHVKLINGVAYDAEEPTPEVCTASSSIWGVSKTLGRVAVPTYNPDTEHYNVWVYVCTTENGT